MQYVSVEVDVSDGLPSFDMIGLLGSEVREAKERIRTGLKNQGYLMKPKRITVNLSPVGIHKNGNYFDLPIAIGILKSLGQIYKDTEDTLIVGGLGLNGEINKVNGIISIVNTSKNMGYKRCIIPFENKYEGGLIEGIDVYAVKNIKEAADLINNNYDKAPIFSDVSSIYDNYQNSYFNGDFCEVFGQEIIKRAAVVAACGMHHFLMIGPPGTGKSMIARRIPTIMPKPSLEECMEITRIHSIAGVLSDEQMICERPFRAPHSSITQSALVGGGIIPKPGEMTMANRGVLFLDEFAEFKNDVIDSLRQPLEEGKITVSRNSGKYVFPTRIMLVAATNPCKCGYYPDRSKCNCSDIQIQNYFGKISGPIMDRIDICVGIRGVDIRELKNANEGLSSSQMRKQVEKGQEVQFKRFGCVRYNSSLSNDEIKKYCILTDDAEKILDKAYEAFEMSLRAYNKIKKVARTIADIDSSEVITKQHMIEALDYRIRG